MTLPFPFRMYPPKFAGGISSCVGPDVPHPVASPFRARLACPAQSVAVWQCYNLAVLLSTMSP